MAARRAPKRALLGGILATVIVLLVGIWLGGHPSYLPSPLRGAFFQSHREQVTDQALDILTTRYFRPLSRSSLVDHGLTGMVASLDDPYSHYIDPRAYRESTEDTGPPTVGIGIDAVAEPEGLRVVTVFDRSPAARAGLRRADLIVKVGSAWLADRPQYFGFQEIRGPAGTRVTLTFKRNDIEHVVSIVRAKVVVPVASGRMVRYHHVDIGYLRLTRFSEDSADELRGEVRTKLKAHARALILDLRGNGGGLINEAIDIASIFIPHGTIMSAVERGQPRRVYMARGDAIAAGIPMVVLVDHGTASSAEIVTAALQDLGRADVVGTHTYGKGVFQQTQSLTNGGALDITIGQFFTPDGRNLGGTGTSQGAGIEPNVHAVDDPRAATDQALAAAERTVAGEVE
jgi:carboxyl-terminal processing protease